MEEKNSIILLPDEALLSDYGGSIDVELDQFAKLAAQKIDNMLLEGADANLRKAMKTGSLNWIQRIKFRFLAWRVFRKRK